jgi:hypothetical protein
MDRHRHQLIAMTLKRTHTTSPLKQQRAVTGSEKFGCQA